MPTTPSAGGRSRAPAPPDPAAALFAGPGEMRARCRAFDWAATPLGPVARWPESLRHAVALMAAMPEPAFVCWGPEAHLLYNDAYAPLLGAKHPGALGRPVLAVWAEAEDVVRQTLATVRAGEPVQCEGPPVPTAGRGAGAGRARFATTWTPLRTTGVGVGDVGGAFGTAVETTARVHAEAALRESATRALVAQLPGGAAFLVDHDLRYLVAEGEALRDAGLAPGDLVGRCVTDFAGPAAEAQVADYRLALAGESFAREHEEHGRAYITRGTPLRDAAGRVYAALAVSYDVTERRAAERRLWASEARQAFLLCLSDALRPLADPAAIEGVACRLLGEHVGADRAWYCEWREADGYAAVAQDYARPGLPSVVGRYPLTTFDWTVPLYKREPAVVIADVRTAPGIPDAGRAATLAAQLVAWVAIPLVKGGTLVGALNVGAAAPRAWTADEVALVHEAAERVWAAVERARAEAALRESEENYRLLFDSIDEGFCVIEVLFDARDEPLDYRFLQANPAFARQTGLGDVVGRTARELVPDHEASWFEIYGHIARTGEPRRFENRAAAIGHWYDVYAFRVGAPAERRVAVLFRDIRARKRAEQLLRASEARQAFLLALGDALRPLADPAAIQGVAARLLGRHLGANQVHYGETVEGTTVVVRQGYGDGLPPMVGTFRHAEEGWGARLLDAYRAGRTAVCADVLADRTISTAEAAVIAGAGFRAYVAVPLVKHGTWVATLAVHSIAPRAWTADEVWLVEDVAQRTWAAVEHARAEAALRASETRARALVATLPGAAVFVVDHALRYRVAEGEAFRAAGFTAEQFVGREVAAVLGPELASEYVPRYRQVLGGEPFEWEHAAHGRVFLSRGVPLHDAPAGPGAAEGGVAAALVVSIDVTHRRAAAEALRTSEERFRTLVDNVRDYAIFLLDPDGVITEWTPGAARVTGYPADEVLGRHFALFYPPEDAAAGVPDHELAVAERVGRGEWEGWRVRRDGTRFWVNEIATAVRDGGGRLVGFTKIARDLTERRRAEEAAEREQLAAARDELRRALAEAEEAERRRLARELHDQLGQELTAVRLGLDDAVRLAASHEGARAVPDAPLLTRLGRLQTLAERLTAGARYLALELRPPELDDLGLESALETYVAEWSARYGVPAELAVTGLAADRPVPAEVGSALYRIVQEALTNVAKHARARQVSVIIEKPDGVINLIVEDDGQGFDPGATEARVRAERRLGLAGMRERAALVGGTVAVESSPGAGTTLYVRLPLAPRAEGA